MKNIGDIDKNLKVLRDFSREGLSYHDALDAPFTVHGVFHNGERFVTYIIKGERGKGQICLNGAAARLVQPDDVVIIMAYAQMTPEEAREFRPTVIFPKMGNKL